MRLIDKDYAVDTAWSIEVYHGSAREVCEMLEDAPIVDAEPVRHGKWLCSDNFYETAVCSVCNCDTDEPYEYAKKSWNFCPNCGAKMDGGRKEECGHQ